MDWRRRNGGFGLICTRRIHETRTFDPFHSPSELSTFTERPGRRPGDSPRLLLADEPTTSLDVIIQDQILSLLLELQQDTGMSMILVSHDLAVISEVCDRIMVMYAGQVVEEGAAADVITAPKHPYTHALIDALPHAGPRGQLRSISGSPPSLIDVPAGCRFAPRCRFAMPDCLTWDTVLVAAGEHEHAARCRRLDEIDEGRETWQPSDSASA
jgi:oligopeptide/dipeptide ABC transporter ATP-binding protein